MTPVIIPSPERVGVRGMRLLECCSHYRRTRCAASGVASSNKATAITPGTRRHNVHILIVALRVQHAPTRLQEPLTGRLATKVALDRMRSQQFFAWSST
jgi:hypothetical protein